jgi:hypothetical protein
LQHNSKKYQPFVRLGKSEVELVNIFIEGVAQIIKWEKQLENHEEINVSMKQPEKQTGEQSEEQPENHPAVAKESKIYTDENYPPLGLADSIRKLPEWIQAGCGDAEYYCEG